jgi:hypothetical protein
MDFNRQYEMPLDEVFVINREPDTLQEYDYSHFDFVTYMAIGIIYILFLAFILDRFLSYDRVENVCRVKDEKPGSAQFNAKREECRNAVNDYDYKKFLYMLVIGFVSVFGGCCLARADPRYMTAGMGIALGGFIGIIYYTIYNWSSISKNIQVLILGLTLAVLLYGSTLL